MNKDDKITTFGCRLNIFESEIIKNHISSLNEENIHVVNTCTVTQQAHKEAIKAIKKIKNKNPDSKIIVTGCAAQIDPESFGNMQEVYKVLGNQEKLLKENYNISQKVIVSDIMSLKETAHHLVTDYSGKSRAFIQIQNGCNHRCAFCIIPYARGNNRSVPVGVIVDHVKLLLDKGFKEIVFTGVDISDYGKDLPGSPTLAELIERLLRLVPELKRLRLSSIDVAEIDEGLFDLMSNCKILMPHFHISLQSGDNKILKIMKRRHNREKVIEFANKIKSIRPEVALGADIIVGFPTETHEMFLNSCSLVDEADLQYLHVFPYSERDNTPASRMPQIDQEIRKERAKLLIKEGELAKEKFYKKHINQTVNVLTEKSNMGHTENFIKVKFDCDVTPGKIVKAKLRDYNINHMKAELYE